MSGVEIGGDGVSSATKATRARRVISARRFVQLATAAVFTLWVVVTSGAVVRLTASGLGCDNWPRCGDKPYPEKGGHAAIEFGNRLVALIGIALTVIVYLAARRVDGLPRWVRNVALATALGTIAQIPLGGITVLLGLNPIAVMSHFLLALVVVGGAVVVALEAWSHSRGLAPAAGPHWLRGRRSRWRRRAARCSSSRERSQRHQAPTRADRTSRGSGSASPTPSTSTCARPRSSGSASSIVGAFLWRLRRELPGIAAAGAVLFGVLLVQMAVGEIQYRNALPWWLVVIHVSLAATIWTLTVAIAYSLHRPPAPLVAPARR